MTQLSEALKQKLMAGLPAGYDIANARLVRASATVKPDEELTAEEEQVVASVAKGPKRITNGRPTLMRVVAWMVHEGVNRNNDGFVKEELEVAAKTITPANPLVMDWNHSAVLGGQDKVIGVWTRATYAFDQKAKGGAGAWGIMVEGVMFAWLFPDIADVMLAEQQRNGKIDFSMACVPETVEFHYKDGSYVSWLHNPCFFTNSGLDVAPGDPDAIGRGREGADEDGAAEALRLELTAAHHEGASMEQIIAHIRAALAKEIPMPETESTEVVAENVVTEPVAEVVAEVVAEEVVAEPVVEAVAEPVAEVIAEQPTLEAQLAAAAVRTTELETANTALQANNEALSSANADLQSQLDAATARIAELEQAQKEIEDAAKLAQRIAELPATYVAAHEALDAAQRATVEASWLALDDAAWAEKAVDLHKASTPAHRIASYLERTRAEGRLPIGGAPESQSIATRIHKFTRS